MAISFQIDERQRCIFTTLRGVVDNWSVGIVVQALLADPRFDKRFSRLVGATQISNLDALQGDFLQSVAQDLSGGTRVALVGRPKMQPILQIYRSYLRNIEYQLFEDKETALVWLGLTDRGDDLTG